MSLEAYRQKKLSTMMKLVLLLCLLIFLIQECGKTQKTQTQLCYYGREQSDSYHPQTPPNCCSGNHINELQMESHQALGYRDNSDWSYLYPLTASPFYLFQVSCLTFPFCRPFSSRRIQTMSWPCLTATLFCGSHTIVSFHNSVPEGFHSSGNPTDSKSSRFYRYDSASSAPQLSAVLFWLPITLTSQVLQTRLSTGSSFLSLKSPIKVHLPHHSL